MSAMALACARTACPSSQPASVAPVLLLRAPATFEPCPPIRSVMGLPTCAPCSVEVTLTDLVTDEGWAYLVAGVRLAGRVAPDRARTGLAWISLDSEEYRHFDRLRRR